MYSKKQISLKAWIKQKWRTKSGKKSSITGERYLPEKAIKALSPFEYRLTTKMKRKATKKLKNTISTLRRRLVSISMIHKMKGHYLDTKHPIIIENLLGIRRVKGSMQKGKKPLLINHLKAIIKVIDEDKSEEIKKIRDKTIILTGFGGGFRRTELISIDYDDLEFVPEGLKITLRRSKTDQFGEGMVKGLPYFSSTKYCPVFHLKKWLELSKIKDGPIFRRFAKGSSLTKHRLTDQTVVLIIKQYFPTLLWIRK